MKVIIQNLWSTLLQKYVLMDHLYREKYLFHIESNLHNTSQNSK